MERRGALQSREAACPAGQANPPAPTWCIKRHYPMSKMMSKSVPFPSFSRQQQGPRSGGPVLFQIHVLLSSDSRFLNSCLKYRRLQSVMQLRSAAKISFNAPQQPRQPALYPHISRRSYPFSRWRVIHFNLSRSFAGISRSSKVSVFRWETFTT